MTDIDLSQTWLELEPGSDQRQKIERRLMADLDAHDTPLLLEWLRALRLAPLATLGLAAISAVAVVGAPAAWLALALS